jgi:hypothetical protein
MLDSAAIVTMPTAYTHRMRFRRGILLLIVAIASIAALGEPMQDRPRLVVLLVADQFRGDYPAMYGDRWTGGLKRLLDEGAVFHEAAYTFGRTTTCGGHATITTGLLPRSHGIIDNQWWDRDRRATVTCAQDSSVTAVGIDGPGAGAAGPANLQSPAIGNLIQDWQQDRGRVLVLSQKARSAVMLAGRGGPNVLALWAENRGHWATSSAYATPWPEVVE